MSDDDPYTNTARGINKRWEAGFAPTPEALKSLSRTMSQVPELRDEKMWGIKQSVYYNINRSATTTHHEIVANPHFFYPQAIVAQDLTYEEAKALKKILES